MKVYNSLEFCIIHFDENDCVRTSSVFDENEDYDNNELPLIPFVK